NDKIDLDTIRKVKPKYITLSPGPGNPSHSGCCIDILQHISPSIPTLGVCLGHQCIGAAYGATIKHATRIMHGKTSLIQHNKQGMFQTIPSNFIATRYHSLV